MVTADNIDVLDSRIFHVTLRQLATIHFLSSKEEKRIRYLNYPANNGIPLFHPLFIGVESCVKTNDLFAVNQHRVLITVKNGKKKRMPPSMAERHFIIGSFNISYG